MCGIIGYMGKKNALSVVMSCLENLEYRGYDSSGLTLRSRSHNNSMRMFKAVGKLSALKQVVATVDINAYSGLGHTRWATHGAPSLANAHPITVNDNEVVVVHNGILENYSELKRKLLAQGCEFSSDTDTEVAAHVLSSLLNEGHEPHEAIHKLCDIVHGAYSFGMMFKSYPDRLFFAKNGSPLIVAYNDGEYFFASDQAALVNEQPLFCNLDDGDFGFISEQEVQVFDRQGKVKNLPWQKLSAPRELAQKMGHKHFMHKEIFEQPATIDRVLSGRLSATGLDISGFAVDFDRIKKANKIQLVACGSAFYAALTAKSQFESRLKISTEVEIASEYRYRDTITDENTLVIALSQSGETIDTLSALTKASAMGAMCLSICNVVGSAIAQHCQKSLGNIFINAGPEISVASTKGFVGQIAALRLFTAAWEQSLGLIDQESCRRFFADFMSLKNSLRNVLALDEEIRALAQNLINVPRMFYMARGDLVPVALEGALKMKELSYIGAEGYPAGELKHGPIALIDEGMPVIVLFGSNSLNIKTASNLQEVKARGATVIAIAPCVVTNLDDMADHVIRVDTISPELEPILATIPLQLLAYHLSDLKGVDVDKPKNLAKSVTVE